MESSGGEARTDTGRSSGAPARPRGPRSRRTFLQACARLWSRFLPTISIRFERQFVFITVQLPKSGATVVRTALPAGLTAVLLVVALSWLAPLALAHNHCNGVACQGDGATNTPGPGHTPGTDPQPDHGNPSPGNPGAGNPSPGNPAAGNPSPGNPDAGNPSPGNPDAGNPSPGNPDAGNPTPTPDPDATGPAATPTPPGNPNPGDKDKPGKNEPTATPPPAGETPKPGNPTPGNPPGDPDPRGNPDPGNPNLPPPVDPPLTGGGVPPPGDGGGAGRGDLDGGDRGTGAIPDPPLDRIEEAADAPDVGPLATGRSGTAIPRGLLGDVSQLDRLAAEEAGRPELVFGAHDALRGAEGIRFPDDITGVATEAFRVLAFPMLLALLVMGFLVLQSRIDRHDPKLANAPKNRDYLDFV